MTSVMNPYDALYTNLKNQFTVIYNGTECTVGDFMLMKANKRSESSLPIATSVRTTSLSTIVEYVNDKLTVKKAPEKDKTFKAFPFRASVAAFLSAVLLCTVAFTYGILSVKGKEGPAAPILADASEEISADTVEEINNEHS